MGWASHQDITICSSLRLRFFAKFALLLKQKRVKGLDWLGAKNFSTPTFCQGKSCQNFFVSI
jgi:hypothetical protein